MHYLYYSNRNFTIYYFSKSNLLFTFTVCRYWIMVYLSWSKLESYFPKAKNKEFYRFTQHSTGEIRCSLLFLFIRTARILLKIRSRSGNRVTRVRQRENDFFLFCKTFLPTYFAAFRSKALMIDRKSTFREIVCTLTPVVTCGVLPRGYLRIDTCNVWCLLVTTIHLHFTRTACGTLRVNVHCSLCEYRTLVPHENTIHVTESSVIRLGYFE